MIMLPSKKNDCHLGHSSDIFVTVQDVYDAIRCQKKAESAGPNGLVMESFMFACAELWVHLSLFFYSLF